MMKNKKLYAAIGATVLICAAAAGFYFSSLAYRLNRLAAGKDCRYCRFSFFCSWGRKISASERVQTFYCRAGS